MPFIPHTEADIQAMLDTIGVADINALFDEVPDDLVVDALHKVPPQLNEMTITRLMRERADTDRQPICFIGAGAYDHHIPAAVWELTTRGEFYSAYTPYQAEASQGTLQLVYEYQSMMAGLMAMDVSNASMYDGASALAEAILMAIRANTKSKSKRILMPRTLPPRYREVVHAICHNQGVDLTEVEYDQRNGRLDPVVLESWAEEDITALVIPQPNFVGQLEAVDILTDWAHANGALAIAVVNPVAAAVLTPPGEWGEKGADIACGDGQPLGIPMSAGGPHFGFMTCRQEHVRRMPGRIVGRTVDLEGRPGFTLTLQAREQHIRRSKATSNICTNQGLMVTAATIHMAMMGAEGLEQTAAASHAATRDLAGAIATETGIQPLFTGSYLHELVLQLDRPVGPVLEAMAANGVLAGFDLSRDYPELGNAILVCATEKRTAEDINAYAVALKDALASGEALQEKRA